MGIHSQHQFLTPPSPSRPPKVSTEGSFRTMALRLAICRVPSARQVVITAGRPSGMAATASATSAAMRRNRNRPVKKGVQGAGF